MNEINIKQLSVGMMRTNCYIVYNDKNEAVIIDPGDSYTKIKDAIISMKLTPVAILLTHGHFDHIGAVSKLKEVYGINIYAYEDEKSILNTPDYNLSNVFGVPIAIEADNYLRDNEEISIMGVTFKVIHTPGHTIGSCCYYLPQYEMMFTGDTLFAGTHGRYDFPTGNGRSLLESITGKLFCYGDNVEVFPGHNEETTIGIERRLY